MTETIRKSPGLRARDIAVGGGLVLAGSVAANVSNRLADRAVTAAERRAAQAVEASKARRKEKAAKIANETK